MDWEREGQNISTFHHRSRFPPRLGPYFTQMSICHGCPVVPTNFLGDIRYKVGG